MKQLKVAVLISGGGTTLRNLIDKHAAGAVNLDFRVVIASRQNIRGIQFAEQAQIPVHVVRRRSFPDPAEHSESIFSICRQAEVDYVLMGGFLSHVLIPSDFEHRVLNTHPSLIPSFCGRGFYGARVHEAVLAFGAKVTGCTIHFVDNEYDHGPIIQQRAVSVVFGDTPETLARRVFAAECEAYPDVLRLLAASRVHVQDGVAQVHPARESR